MTTIQIYPIACQLVRSSGAINANILKVGDKGILVNTGAVPMKVHETITAVFILPLKNVRIETPVIVFKTYDQFKGAHGDVQPGHHVAEMVFKNLSAEHKRAVGGFVVSTSSLTKN